MRNAIRTALALMIVGAGTARGQDPPMMPAAAVSDTTKVGKLTLEQLKTRLAAGGTPNLTGADLSGLDLTGIYFKSAALTKANFAGATLSGANLFSCDLTGAVLTDARLLKTNLDGSTLRRADFRRADLTGASLYATIIEDADLSGANLTGTR